MNKLNKLISLYFYDEEKNSEYQLKLKLENILLFRDSLVKKMRTLRVKVESQKLIKGQQQVKRLTEKEIKEMKINDIEKNTNELKERIEKGEITDYTVNTFTTLCGKAIEHFSMIGNDKYKEYVDMMKSGIIDPAKVVKTAIMAAASTAGVLLTTGAVMTEIPEEKPIAPAGGGMPGMM